MAAEDKAVDGRLAVTTVLPAQPGSGDPYVTFGPGDDVPKWAAKQIDAHCWEGGVHPLADGDADPERVPGSEPPRAGRGSGRDNWAAFAGEHGVDVAEDDSRDAIIQKLTDAGIVSE